MLFSKILNGLWVIPAQSCMKNKMTANTSPVVNEPIISSDFWATESYLMHNILNAIEIKKDK